jgi:uncharacterized membrane protein
MGAAVPFRDELERRSEAWVASGVITDEQRQRILASDPAPSGAGSRLVPIFSLLGAALVALGVFLVVSQNWDEIPKLTKLSVGVVLMVAAFAAGYWLRFGPLGMRKTGEGVLLIGSGMFLANLALVSQQYSIDFNPSPLLIPVLLTSMVLAYLLNSRSYIFVSGALAIIWLISESQREGSGLETRSSAALILVAGAGVWLLAAAEANRRIGWGHFAEPLRIASAICVFAALYWLGFYRHFNVDEGMAALPSVTIVLLPLIMAIGGLIAIGLSAETRLGWPTIAPELRQPVLSAALALALLLGWSFMVGTNPRDQAEEDFIIYTVGYWVLAVGLTASLIWLGLALRREWWVNAGLGYIGLFALTRYFDLFSDYAQTGAMFSGAGLFLLVLAFLLERGRRAMRDEMAEGGAA